MSNIFKNVKIVRIAREEDGRNRKWSLQHRGATVTAESEETMEAKTNVTIIYIIGGSPRLVLSPESIRRVGLSIWETKLVIFSTKLVQKHVLQQL